jgi:gamma-glutamylcyclotransferase (GGCT)/AIG2-like uncharacterized protein YtfP
MDESEKTHGADGGTVWYFAYGSNLDPERFRARVCDFADRKRAVLHDYRLRFSGEVTSEGGGGAIIEQSKGDKAYGGVYRIDRAQIERMDEIELGSDKNPAQRGVRCTITLQCPGGSLDAEVYVVPKPEVYRRPSAKYLGHIVAGLRSFGYSETEINAVRAIAAREP